MERNATRLVTAALRLTTFTIEDLRVFARTEFEAAKTWVRRNVRHLVAVDTQADEGGGARGRRKKRYMIRDVSRRHFEAELRANQIEVSRILSESGDNILEIARIRFPTLIDLEHRVHLLERAGTVTDQSLIAQVAMQARSARKLLDRDLEGALAEGYELPISLLHHYGDLSARVSAVDQAIDGRDFAGVEEAIRTSWSKVASTTRERDFAAWKVLSAVRVNSDGHHRVICALLSLFARDELHGDTQIFVWLGADRVLEALERMSSGTVSPIAGNDWRTIRRVLYGTALSPVLRTSDRIAYWAFGLSGGAWESAYAPPVLYLNLEAPGRRRTRLLESYAPDLSRQRHELLGELGGSPACVRIFDKVLSEVNAAARRLHAQYQKDNEVEFELRLLEAA